MPPHQRRRPVLRAIVDHQNLVLPTRERGRYSVQGGAKPASLVVGGNDDGEIGGHRGILAAHRAGAGLTRTSE